MSILLCSAIYTKKEYSIFLRLHTNNPYMPQMQLDWRAARWRMIWVQQEQAPWVWISELTYLVCFAFYFFSIHDMELIFPYDCKARWWFPFGVLYTHLPIMRVCYKFFSLLDRKSSILFRLLLDGWPWITHSVFIEWYRQKESWGAFRCWEGLWLLM